MFENYNYQLIFFTKTAFFHISSQTISVNFMLMTVCFVYLRTEN